MWRRTKIVCTIGPASNSDERVRSLLMAGMNVARLNFSHGSHEEHAEQYHRLRTAAEDLGANLAIMMDLQGPKIRTGPMRNGEAVELHEGRPFTITVDDIVGDETRTSTTYKQLHQDVVKGSRILLADGMLELYVNSVVGNDILCTVVRGGFLGQHKGINLPGVRVTEPSMTAKDKEDLEFGLQLGVDYVALSFVRSPDDIRGIKAFIRERGGKAGVVAKIERPEAVQHMEAIAALSDAVMVARGDLGVEMDFEEVPEIQKRLIHTCNELGVPVITATQMLESMVNHPRPTRAEVGDVANAIFDGTDAVMLSGESAAGQYPVEACAVMAKIAFKADAEMASAPPAERWVRLRSSNLSDRKNHNLPPDARHETLADAIGQAVVRMAMSLKLKRIVCFTRSGYTALALARYRPPVRITAITNSEETQRRLALLWGVYAYLSEDVTGVDDMVKAVEAILLDQGLARQGDTVAIVAGTPLAVGGRTNLLKLHTLGEE
ncbi:MAG: pyruvate kinase [Candidatus Hydrogenedentes bacterium]|nr:pyruvate kinase [Candidatus Hydrogenedentota bacterium]